MYVIATPNRSFSECLIIRIGNPEVSAYEFNTKDGHHSCMLQLLLYISIFSAFIMP